MIPPVSDSQSSPQEPRREHDHEAQRHGHAKQRPKQPAFEESNSRPDMPLSRPTPRLGPSGARTARDGPDLASMAPERRDASANEPRALRWVAADPTQSFIAGERGNVVVIGPEGYNTVVGAATEAGTVLTGDGRDLSVHEAIAMSLAFGNGTAAFYLAVDGAQDGGAASLAQRWASISGVDVIVRTPTVKRDPKGRTVIEGKGPLHRFSPKPFEARPVLLAIEHGALVTRENAGNRTVLPRAHLREKLGSGGEGAVFRLGENLAAKMFFPDVDALGLIARGKRVLERRAAEGFRVARDLAPPRRSPGGLVVQYLELGAASDRDILTTAASAHEADGRLPIHGYFSIDHARAQTLGAHTIAELDKMRELLEVHRPFHRDREFNDPEIMFDRDGLPYLSDPVQDMQTDFPAPEPDALHAEALQVIAVLRKVAHGKA